MRLIDADVLKQDLSRFYDGIITAKELIDSQPTVELLKEQPPRKKGHWIIEPEKAGNVTNYMFRCSICHCGERHAYEDTCVGDYCQWCGAELTKAGKQE